MERGCNKNIKIQDLGLNCYGPLREKRFGTPGTRGFDGKFVDGIHMRGILALKHYKDSFIRMLRPNITNSWAGRGQKRSDFHNICPQTVYQGHYKQHQRRGNREQNAGYRKQMNRGFNRNNTQKFENTNKGFQQNEYSSSYGKNIYTIPVNNKFPENY